MIDDANQHSAEAAYEAMLGDYDPHDAEMWDGIAADTAEPPVLNVAECEAFIRNWLKDTGTGHITLTSIPASSGNTTTKTFTPDTFKAMGIWLKHHQRLGRNIYFQPNETHAQCTKKPQKGEMIAALCRHADIDPVDDVYPYADERDRLHHLADFLHQQEMPPTVLLDSGNGIYPLFVTGRQLLTPDVVETVEAENAAIEAMVGAKGTWDIDRLLRVPGTVNYPNAKKLTLGRGVTRARVLHYSGRTYTPEQAATLPSQLQALLGDSDLVRPVTADPPPDEQASRKTSSRQTTGKKSQQDRSAAAFGKDAECRREGKAFEEMCDILANDPETQDWYSEKGQINNKRELHRIGERYGDAPRSNHGPIIRVTAGELHIDTTAAESALIASGLPIFQHGGKRLVRPVTHEVRASHNRTTTAAGLGEMTTFSMIDVMSETAKYEKYDARSKDWVRINPPGTVAQILLSQQGKWRFPVIAGVITTPTLRPDGSLLTKPGYDPVTRLYHAADPTLKLDQAIHAPTRDLAERALKTLTDELLSEFPFVKTDDGKEVSKAVALSGIITPIVRGAMSVSPLHAFNAHAPGSGKSYLVDVMSAVATGRYCPVITVGRDEAEAEKRLGGLLKDGLPLISLDNINGELGGDLLCQATERPLIRVRALGKSDIFEVENTVCIFGTGNNLRVVGDMVRRTLVAELDPQVERPELRKFNGDPVTRVLADRGRYVSACLIIVRAYVAAGSPGKLDRIASYSDWSDLVRSALVWLGCADPADSMASARDDDPVLNELREMLSIWHSTFGFEAQTTSAIAKKSEEHTEGGMRRYPDLTDVLIRLFGQRGTINARQFGNWLLDREGRIVSVKLNNGLEMPLRFRRAGKYQGYVRWQLQDARNS